MRFASAAAAIVVAAFAVAALAQQQTPAQVVPKGQAQGQTQGAPPLGNAPAGTLPPLGNLKGGGQLGTQGGPGAAGAAGGGAVAAVGPRCDDTRTAVSTDGMMFRVDGGVALVQASVPDAVFFRTGLFFYYVGGGERHGIFRARTHDDVWERGDEVLIGGAFNQNAVDPDAVALPDGRVRLYYFEGNFRGAQVLAPGAASPFFAAVSEDGIHFTPEGKVFETPGGTDPSVVRLADGSWLLAVARAMTREMVIARADDGLHFSQIATLGDGGIPELMALDDGRVRLLFNGQGGMTSRISADGGRTWTDETGARLQYQGFAADPSVVRLPDGTWRLFFKTMDQACQAAVAQARGLGQGGGGGGGGQGQGGGVQGTPKGPLGVPKGTVTP